MFDVGVLEYMVVLCGISVLSYIYGYIEGQQHLMRVQLEDRIRQLEDKE